jgi:hypothetical protein
LDTDSFLKIIEEGTNIQSIQEPYTIRNKIVSLPKTYKILASGEGRKRAAIVVNNNQVDTLLINQLSDEDAVVLEAKIDNTRFIIVSMYLYINRSIGIDMQKIEATLAHATVVGVIIAMDSNSRSTSCQDILANSRGKILEKILNEQSVTYHQ